MDRIRYCPFWILILQDCSIVHSSRYRNKIDNTVRRYRDKIDNTARTYRDRINPHNRVTQTAGTRMDMCAMTETNTKTACFSTRDTANTNLLISCTWSHDACIVRVSDKTLFILRERSSQARDGVQITTWHCRIHRLMCSPSNSQSRSRHRETESRQETTDKICLHCPAKDTPATAGKQNHPAEPVPHTKQRTCLLDNKKLCTSKRVQNGKLWQHKDVHGSVSSCSLSLCECIQNLFLRMRTACLRIDSASHWTLYNNVFHGMRFSAHRQLMSYLTRETIHFN